MENNMDMQEQMKEESKVKDNSRLKKIADEMMQKEDKVWTKLKINSGTQLYQNEDIQKEYFTLMHTSIKRFFDYYKFSKEEKKKLEEIFEEENRHSLNNYIALEGLYQKKDQKAYIDFHTKMPYMFLNPANSYSVIDDKDGDFITKEEWNKKQKDSKLKSEDGKYYVMAYDDNIGTYLKEVKVMANGGEIKVGDKIRLKKDLPYMASLSNLYNKDLKVDNVTETYFASGTKKYYHVTHDGDKYEVREDFVDNERMAHGGETDNKITFSVDDEKIDEMLHNSFESQLEYVNDNGDVLYKLPKRQFDRLIDMADSRGFDVDYENSEESVIIVYDNYADGGETEYNLIFIEKSDEELKGMNDDELFAYLDAKAAYMKQYKRPLSAYKAKNFAANAAAVQYQKEGTSKLEDKFPSIEKINKQAEQDYKEGLKKIVEKKSMADGGEVKLKETYKYIADKSLFAPLRNGRNTTSLKKGDVVKVTKIGADGKEDAIVANFEGDAILLSKEKLQDSNKFEKTMASGGKTSVSPLKDRIIGSKKNKVGTASSKTSAKDIELNDSIVEALSEKAKEYNEKHSKKVSLSTLKAVMRRGMGAFSSSHRPGMTRQGWGYARVNKFLLKKGGTKVKATYTQDDDLLENGGELKKEMRVSDKPKFKKLIELENRIKDSMYKPSNVNNFTRWNETTGANYSKRWNKMVLKLRGWNDVEGKESLANTKKEWLDFCKENDTLWNYNFGDVLA